jgi:hypothetical protein
MRSVAEYLRAYAACCRGDSDDVRHLLTYYGARTGLLGEE